MEDKITNWFMSMFLGCLPVRCVCWERPVWLDVEHFIGDPEDPPLRGWDD